MAEYSLILALVLLAGVLAYGLLGDTVAGLYDRIVSSFT